MALELTASSGARAPAAGTSPRLRPRTPGVCVWPSPDRLWPAVERSSRVFLARLERPEALPRGCL
eukprot:5360920-Alexandrium_andersonii.AAC.1